MDPLQLVLSGGGREASMAAVADAWASGDFWLRVNAVQCIGHMARIHGKVDVASAIPMLREAAGSGEFDLSGAADTALDDLETFIEGFRRGDHGFPEQPAETL